MSLPGNLLWSPCHSSAQDFACHVSPVVLGFVMGKPLRSRKFQAPPKAKTRKKTAAVKNTQHKEAGVHCSVSLPARNPGLTGLKQEWSYPDICKLSDPKAKTLLQEAGVVPRGKEWLLCWQCGAEMKPCASSSTSSGSSAIDCKECPVCRTASRHRLQMTHCSLAFTPFWGSCCAQIGFFFLFF